VSQLEFDNLPKLELVKKGQKVRKLPLKSLPQLYHKLLNYLLDKDDFEFRSDIDAFRALEIMSKLVGTSVEEDGQITAKDVWQVLQTIIEGKKK